MYFDKMQHFGLEQMPSEGGAIISVYSSSAVKEATLRMTKNDCVRVARQKQSITPIFKSLEIHVFGISHHLIPYCMLINNINDPVCNSFNNLLVMSGKEHTAFKVYHTFIECSYGLKV